MLCVLVRPVVLSCSSTVLFSNQEPAASNGVPVRQRCTGWVQRMNNSLSWAQTSWRETNIQQHLCVWKSSPPSTQQFHFLGENFTPVSPQLCFLQNCQTGTAVAWNVRRKYRSVYSRLCCVTRLRNVENIMRAGSHCSSFGLKCIIKHWSQVQKPGARSDRFKTFVEVLSSHGHGQWWLQSSRSYLMNSVDYGYQCYCAYITCCGHMNNFM